METTRTLDQMEKVLYDQEWFKTAPKDLELYQVQRNIKTDQDLRYDITKIPGQMLGKEFTRTKGNYNSKGYEELYTVLQGTALFYLQKENDVIVIETKKGQSIIVPPHYTIITINPSQVTLRTGNWVSNNTENIYKDLEEMQGPAYFYTQNGWIKNNKYENIPEIRFEQPTKEPENLDFLRKEN